MGISIDMLAVQSLIAQLNSIEAEALSMMTARTNLAASKTNLSNKLLDLKSSAKMEPSEADYYYTKSVGTDGSGNTYTIDSRYQDYQALTTDKGAYINLTATKTSRGTTLSQQKPVSVLQGKAFTGTVVSPLTQSFDTPDTDKPATGVVAKVTVVDPTSGAYKVLRPRNEWKETKPQTIDGDAEYDLESMYRDATADDKPEDLIIFNGATQEFDKPYANAENVFTLAQLEGCSNADYNSANGTYNPSVTKICAGTRYVYFPNGCANQPSGGKPIHVSDTGDDQLQQAFNDDQSLNNLYYIDNGRQCKKVGSIEEYNQLKSQGKTFVIKSGNVTTNSSVTGTYYDIDASDSTPKTVGGYSTYDMNTAVDDGTVPAEVCNDLIESAIHYFGAQMGYDADGNTSCDAEYIKNNYDIVKLGDDKWGLVNKNIQAGDKASIYEIDTDGEYQEPVGQISAHNLQFDTDGNLVGFQTDNNEIINLTAQRVFDKEGYDKAMKEYAANLKASEVEEANVEKDINELAQEDTELEQRLTYLNSMKTVVEGFLEAAKSLAKSDAERLSKSFSA